MSKPMLLDFNDFDCCDQNDDETTLKHRNDGHKIILSHASLPDDAVENLKAMPKMLAEGGDAGGKAPVPSQDNSQGPSDMKRTLHDVGTAASGGTNKPTLDPRSWWADGGKVDKKENTLDYKEITNRKKQMNHEEASKPPMPRKRFAEGGSAGLPCLNPHCSSHGKPHQNCRCYGPGGPSSENYAEGGEVEPQVAYCAYGFPHHAGCEFAKGGKVEKKEGISVQGHDVRHGDMGMAKEEAQGRAREERHVRPQMQGLAQGGNVQRYADGTPNVEDIQMPEEQIQGQAPQAVPAQEQPYQPQTTAFPEAAPGAMQTVSPNNSMVQADQQLAQEKSLGDHEGDEDQKNAYDLANGHITPKTYSDLYADKQTGGKIATLFGMLASGFGSGLSHQPNAVLSMMDNALNKDFEARKESKKNQMNLWDLNYKHALEQAQAHNTDVNSDYVKQQTADIADARYQMQQGRAEYQKMIDRANSLPPGPQRDAAFNAAAIAGQALEKRSLTIRDQLDSKVRVLNQGKGLPEKTSIFNPHPSIMKPPSGGKSQGKDASKKDVEDPYQDHLLSPNANSAFTTLQYNPLYKDQLPAIAEQKQRADLADKAIDTIKENFPKLYKETGGAGGYLRRQGHNLESIPYIGSAINSATNYATDTNENANYDSDYNNLVGAVRGALQGNVSEDLLNKTVSDSRPETNDPDQLKQKKMQNMIDFIRSHVKTDMLPPHLLHKGKKK